MSRRDAESALGRLRGLCPESVARGAFRFLDRAHSTLLDAYQGIRASFCRSRFSNEGRRFLGSRDERTRPEAWRGLENRKSRDRSGLDELR